MTTPLLPYTKNDPRAIDPVRNNPDDAGIDIFALEEVVIRPGEVVSIRTGLQIALDEGQTALAWDKSGRAKVGLTILGGCIDGPYRGELKVVATNVNIWPIIQTMLGRLASAMEIGHNAAASVWAINNAIQEATITVPYGKALTQILVVETKFPRPDYITPKAYEALPKTSRGTNGFGSSDVVDHLKIKAAAKSFTEASECLAQSTEQLETLVHRLSSSGLSEEEAKNAWAALEKTVAGGGDV